MVDKYAQWKCNIKRSGAAWKEATWVFVLSRVIILILTYIGVSRFPVNGQAQKIDCSLNINLCLMSWNQWDVANFIQVALYGYKDPHLTAFFPLWPLMISLFDVLFGHSVTVAYIGVTLLSNACFFAALVVLYNVIDEDFEPSIARMTLFFLAFSPLGLFYFTGYSESLFLLLIVLLFYSLQRAVRGSALAWWLAGLCGLGATLTRAPGIVLLAPYVVVLVQHYWPLWKGSWEKKMHWGHILNAALPMLLIPAGILLYMAYLGITKGNPLLFSVEERVIWHRHLDWPWVGTVNTLRYIFSASTWSAQNIFDFSFTYIPIIVLIAGWKRVPLHYNMFTLATVALILLTPGGLVPGTLSSAPRFAMVAFPTTVVLAIWSKNPRWEKALLAFTFVFFTMHLLFFVTARWAG